MKQIESILVVLDKPKHTQAALIRARELQQQNGAHLHLASFCWQSLVEEADLYSTHQRRAMRTAILHDRQEWLQGQIADHGLGGADVSTETVWTNDIAHWVSEQAQQKRVDLVMKTAHRSDAFLHTPLDWQLLRECPVPLYLVTSPRRRRGTSKPSKKQVLAALDFSNRDKTHRTLNVRVLDAAECLSNLMDARLHCVNVIEYSEILADLEFVNTRKVRKDKTEKVSVLLAALIEPYGIAKSRIHLPAGKVGHLVNATARKIDADLLVLGTAARRGMGAKLLGNSAERILDRASCDVLVVHP